MKEIAKRVLGNRDLHRVFWILLATPFFTPAILGVLEGTELLETLFDLWRFGAAAVIAALYLWQFFFKRRLPALHTLLFGLYLLAVTVSSFIHAENYSFVLTYVVTLMGFFLLLELSLRDSPQMLLDMLFYPLSLLIAINFILLCLFPNGLCTGGTYGYDYNFLGIDNFIGPILIPYMSLAVLRSDYMYGDLTLSTWILLGVSTLTCLLLWSATALMAMAAALFFILFFYHRRLAHWFNGVTALLPSLGMFFGIVLFRLQNLFAFLIEGILHKGLSFTGRTEIWDTAIEKILASPYLGWGVGQRGKVYRLSKYKFYHAHNLYLELMMEGGILGAIPFMLLVARCTDSLMQHRKCRAASIISGGLLSCGIMTCMEPYLDTNGVLIYALVFLGCSVGAFTGGPNADAPALTHKQSEA